MEEQWDQLQHLALLSQVEQHQAQGQITEAFAVLRQAMAQAPDDADLNAKLAELLASPQPVVDGSAVEQTIDVTTFDLELSKIEMLLDQLEERLTQQQQAVPSDQASTDGEISYL